MTTLSEVLDKVAINKVLTEEERKMLRSMGDSIQGSLSTIVSMGDVNNIYEDDDTLVVMDASGSPLVSGVNNDYDPEGYTNETDVILLYGSSDPDKSVLTGLTGGFEGRVITLVNVGGPLIRIANAGGEGSSADENEFDLRKPVPGGITLAYFEAITFFYSEVYEPRWFNLNHHEENAAFYLRGMATVDVTSNLNNWVIDELHENSVILLNPDADRNITGIASYVPASMRGQVFIFINISDTYSITFKNQDGSSLINHRFSMGADLVLGPLKSAIFIYSDEDNKWHNIGAGAGVGGHDAVTLDATEATLQTLTGQVLALKPHVAFGANAAIDYAGAFNAGSRSLITVETFTVAASATTLIASGLGSNLTINPSANAAKTYYTGVHASLATTPANTQPILLLGGYLGNVQHVGDNNADYVHGISFNVGNSGGGNIDEEAAAYLYVDHYGSGTITSMVGSYVEMWVGGIATAAIGQLISLNNDSGTATNFYGLKIEDIAGASTLNYAIKTGTGLVDFGDGVNIPTGKTYNINGSPHTHSYLPTSAIDDTAYGSGWNGDTTHAPTKNALYDKIETLATGGKYRQFVWVNDGAGSWGFVSADDGSGQYEPVLNLENLE